MTITFFGHRKMQLTETIRTTLKNTLEELIKTDTEKQSFCVGDMGRLTLYVPLR